MHHPSLTLVEQLFKDRRLRLERGALLGRAPAPLPAARFRDRAAGMLIGLAVGDALGNTSEGRNPDERRRQLGEVRDYLPNRHADGSCVGLPSDDTQLAFWLLEHLLEHDGRVEPAALAQTWATRRIFGIGKSMREFVDRFREERRPWEEAGVASAGNGALMRVAPVLLPHLAAPSPALWADAILASMVTHNDATSTSACVAFAAMLWDLIAMDAPPAPAWWLERYVQLAAPLEGAVALRSRKAGDAWRGPLHRFVAERCGAALAAGLPTREACDGWYSGAYLLETVPSALYILARHGHDAEEAIVRAVNDTRDNDTVAAIVGAAVGALHGRSGLPPRWLGGLTGRTAEADDGRVFALVELALDRWTPA